MMKAAVDAARGVSPATKVIAVTVLTSLSDEDLPSVGLTPPAGDQVLRLAPLAQQCGLDGVVCSAHEIARAARRAGTGLPAGGAGHPPRRRSDLGDQRRVMGPAEALQGGADILVIGRPITAAPGPRHGGPRYCPKPRHSSGLSMGSRLCLISRFEGTISPIP